MFDIAMRALCDYSDQLAAQGRHNERKVVQDCIAVIHNIYKEYEDNRRKVGSYQVRDIIESHILGMKGMTVFQHNGNVWYEFPSVSGSQNIRREDRTDEVVKFLVNSWNANFGDIQSAYIKAVTKDIAEQLKKEIEEIGDSEEADDRKKEMALLANVTRELRQRLEAGIAPRVMRGHSK